MAGWEEELAVLLRELGVKQEEPKTHLRHTRKPRQSDVKRREQYADAIIWDKAKANDDDDLWKTEMDLSTMRHKVDGIVNQVVRLIQRGDLEPALKEDVMVVLRALRRRASVTQIVAESEEAYLEFATAMLHFCRLILQISEVASEEDL